MLSDGIREVSVFPLPSGWEGYPGFVIKVISADNSGYALTVGAGATHIVFSSISASGQWTRQWGVK